MAETILQTNPPEKGIVLQLRADSYTNWSTSRLILKAGEAAIAFFPAEDPSLPPAAIGIKVGDGRHYFDELPWIQAIAADVYNWAKASEKPTYTANEIDDLDEYIATHAHGGGGSGESSGTYRISYDQNQIKYTVQKWDTTSNSWTNTQKEIDTSDNLLTRIDTLERWANGASVNLGVMDLPLTAYVYDSVVTYLSSINYSDNPIEGQFVTEVDQSRGKIKVDRSPINLSNIHTGVLATENGGTGLTEVEANEVLVGSNSGNITTKEFTTNISVDNRDSFATTGAIIQYVAENTTGLINAMHFIGEATVPIANAYTNPRIPGYNFGNPELGDVILANNTQQYIWTESGWQILGDKSRYDQITTIANELENKVDKIEGKGLSTEDYTTAEKEKLAGIEAQAQVNNIAKIIINGTAEYEPDENKEVHIQLSQNTFDLDVLDGGQYLDGNTYVDIPVSNKKLILHKIAATGNINDLVQTQNSYVTFYCGSSTEVM